MLYLVFDSSDILRFMSSNWPQARSALDLLISEDPGTPRLEIHAGADLLFD